MSLIPKIPQKQIRKYPDQSTQDPRSFKKSISKYRSRMSVYDWSGRRHWTQSAVEGKQRGELECQL